MSKGRIALLPHDAKHATVLRDFIEYCRLHPEERFWQALRNWSGQSFIVATNFAPADFGKADAWMHDTFYWKGKGSDE